MAPSTKVTKRRKGWLYKKSAATFRWLHIYISMLSFASLMFFSFTGITLNHPTWFGGSQQIVTDVIGSLPEQLASELTQENIAADRINRLGFAEWLRSQHSLKGAVAEFDVSEYECMIVFKGPGYAADVFIDNETKEYSITQSQASFMAVMNDLHKGRDTGAGWAWLIDISAVVLMVMGLTGFGLLMYLKKRRVKGVIVAVAGTIAMIATWIAFVA